jgi:hypothetical protein
MEPRQWEVQGEVMLPGSGLPSAAVEAPYNFLLEDFQAKTKVAWVFSGGAWLLIYMRISA